MHPAAAAATSTWTPTLGCCCSHFYLAPYSRLLLAKHGGNDAQQSPLTCPSPAPLSSARSRLEHLASELTSLN